jgi:uncharacterized membrane protein YidH (DUF202 family)
MQEFIQNVQREIINPFITLLALGAFIVFIWGIVEFIRNGDNAEKRKTGQQHMMWGVVGMVILFGAQAIVAIIARTV